MTGVDLDQWRGNIGMFNRHKTSPTSLSRNVPSDDFMIFMVLFRLIYYTILPAKLGLSLILLFCYCAYVLSFLPIIFVGHVVIKNSLFFICPFDVQNMSIYIPNSFLTSFVAVHVLPINIVQMLRQTYRFLSTLSTKTKNAFFFIFVLHILLVISGLETNPGPEISRKLGLSFAVWNLDSLPARGVC